jgi:hypothetical protein
MELPTICITAAILMATYFIVRSIARGVAIIENSIAIIENSIERKLTPIAAVESASDRRAVASIAGVLLAHRLNSSAYRTELEAAEVETRDVDAREDYSLALGSPTLSKLAAESRQLKRAEASLEREREKSVSIAIGVLDKTARELRGRS